MAIADHAVKRQSIEESLRTLLAVEDSGVDNEGLRKKLLSLQTKIASGQLHVAVLGQMKRGKSSFINALLGSEILPTGVLPITAIITEIRYGEAAEATIVYSTGGFQEGVNLSALANYITESGNPGNRKQVASVEVIYPSHFLQGGIVLIDTPGIGSTHAHNTQTTERYLERVDAGIVVLSVDPPITELEFQFLKRLKNDVPKLFFILNKTDSASAEEIDKIARFLENELSRLQIESPEIFPLSARQALQEKRGDPSHSVSSGIEVFEKRLETFLSQEKRGVLVQSVAFDTLQIARTLRFAASIGLRAGEMDADELLRKRLALDRLLEQSANKLRALQVLLHQNSADILATVERDLAAQVDTYVTQVQQHLKLLQVQQPRLTGRSFGLLIEGFLMKEVEEVFQRWRLQEDEKIQALLDELCSHFVAQGNDILETLGEASGTLFDIPVEDLAITCSLRVESHLCYKIERVFSSLDSFLLLLPRFLQHPIVFRRIHKNIPLLFDMNAGRIRYDYLERLQSSMAQFEKEIYAGVTMVTESLKSALHNTHGNTTRQGNALNNLDSVIRDCSQFLW